MNLEAARESAIFADAGCRATTFFLKAEDGIRDDLVTGVQTCALPISPRLNLSVMRSAIRAISVYTRSRAPEEFGPVAAASDARSSRVSGIPAVSAAASSPRRDRKSVV